MYQNVSKILFTFERQCVHHLYIFFIFKYIFTVLVAVWSQLVVYIVSYFLLTYTNAYHQISTL